MLMIFLSIIVLQIAAGKDTDLGLCLLLLSAFSIYKVLSLNILMLFKHVVPQHRESRRPSDLHSLDGLVIPGGESTTLSKLLTVCDMWEPIADLLREGLPVYGSCAGMILLAKEVLDTRQDARCFGAMDTTVRRNAFGRQVDSFEADLTITPGWDETV